MRKLVLALLFALASASPSMAAVCSAIPALPDTERRTEYTGIVSQTGPFNISFQLYGDQTDYGNWLEVWVNGVKKTAVTDFTVTSPSGALGSLCLPISNAQVTFTAAQTGTIEIVGARRPRRASQFAENKGVTAHDLNQVVSDMTAMERERWDMIQRTLRTPPGDTVGTIPVTASRLSSILGFDSTGAPIALSPLIGLGTVIGPNTTVVGNVVNWNSTNGSMVADAGVQSASIVRTIEDFGAKTTNTAAANLTAIQSALDSTPTGGSLAILKTGYGVAGNLTISHPMRLICAGADVSVAPHVTQTTASSNLLTIHSGNVTIEGCSFGLAGSPTGTATGIIVGDDAKQLSCAFVNGNTTVTCASGTFTAGDVNKSFDAQNVGVAGGPLLTNIASVTDATHVVIGSAPGATNAAQNAAYGFDYQEVTITHVKVNNFVRGLNIVAASRYHVLESYFLASDPLILQNQIWGDSGDGEVIGNTFAAAVAGSHNTVTMNSGGGIKFIGNKVLAQAAISNCIEINWNYVTSVGPFMSSNSIEGACVNGINIDGSVALHVGAITGNEIAVSGTGVSATPAAAHPSWSFTGNVVRASNNNTGFSLANLTGVTMTGNAVQNADASGSGTAYVMGGTITGYLNTGFTSQAITLANSSASLIIDNMQGLAFANLPGVAANGSRIYVTNGTVGTTPCTGGGTGAIANRLNGAWSCGNPPIPALVTNSAAPSTPAAGTTQVWVDSTDKRLHDKNDAGTVGTTVVADTGAANNFLTAISAAGVITKAQPSISNISGLGTGVATALGVNVGSAGAFVTFNGALGTPSSGTLTNATGLPLTTGVTGILPFTGGGTNNSSSYPDGAIVYSDGTKLTQNNAVLYWDRINGRICINIGSAGCTFPMSVLGAGQWGGTLSGPGIRYQYGGTTASGTLIFGRNYNNDTFNSIALSTTTNDDFKVDLSGNSIARLGLVSISPTSGLGYATGAGGAVTQASSRTTGVTLNTVTGAITLVSAAGSTTPATFTLTDSAIAATDVVHVTQKSGTDVYEIFVTNTAAGSCKITFFTTGGTTTEQPVFNFVVIKGVAS